jgi:membrane protein DedA with SNARE-associated domain
VPIASITSQITSFIGDHGVYAVFLLMLIDAVFPAASEVVMVYAGALAGGAFAGQSVTLFGAELSSGFGAYLAMALAGTLGYLVGAIIGWAVGVHGGRPLLDRHGRWLHLNAERLDRAERWFDERGVF